jgi:hypothetical protein
MSCSSRPGPGRSSWPLGSPSPEPRREPWTSGSSRPGQGGRSWIAGIRCYRSCNWSADVERVIGTAELDENAASEPVMVLDEAEQTAVEDIPALNTFQSEEVKAVEDVEGQHCDTQVATVKPEETT